MFLWYLKEGRHPNIKNSQRLICSLQSWGCDVWLAWKEVIVSCCKKLPATIQSSSISSPL